MSADDYTCLLGTKALTDEGLEYRIATGFMSDEDLPLDGLAQSKVYTNLDEARNEAYRRDRGGDDGLSCGTEYGIRIDATEKTFGDCLLTDYIRRLRHDPWSWFQYESENGVQVFAVERPHWRDDEIAAIDAWLARLERKPTQRVGNFRFAHSEIEVEAAAYKFVQSRIEDGALDEVLEVRQADGTISQIMVGCHFW